MIKSDIVQQLKEKTKGRMKIMKNAAKFASSLKLGKYVVNDYQLELLLKANETGVSSHSVYVYIVLHFGVKFCGFTQPATALQ